MKYRVEDNKEQKNLRKKGEPRNIQPAKNMRKKGSKEKREQRKKSPGKVKIQKEQLVTIKIRTI